MHSGLHCNKIRSLCKYQAIVRCILGLVCFTPTFICVLCFYVTSVFTAFSVSVAANGVINNDDNNNNNNNNKKQQQK